jgi:hypothetical protein
VLPVAAWGPAALVVVSSGRYLAPVSMRILPPGFVPPCLPTKAERPPSGEMWLHEIKHDGFRVIARKDGAKMRLYSRPGNDLTYRFPLIVESLARLRSHSCIIDGEAVSRGLVAGLQMDSFGRSAEKAGQLLSRPIPAAFPKRGRALALPVAPRCRESLAGKPGGIVRRKENSDAGDVVRLPEATKRCACDHRFLEIAVHDTATMHSLGLDAPGAMVRLSERRYVQLPHRQRHRRPQHARMGRASPICCLMSH